MDTDGFWHLIDRARGQSEGDADVVAANAADLLAAMAPEEIIAAHRLLWERLAVSYTAPLWAAAYVINGGCSDDGFEYFRGWLVAQGRDVFERAMADPDSLADHPAVQAAAEEWEELECEPTLGVARSAYQRSTGEPLPQNAWHISYPTLGGEFWFDFEDSDRLARKLPRLTALHDRRRAG
ncbi:DUF4240 domain-containing protein [Actinospica durhamensis]|uniref:DUF4240 domain-containing protein n=1 Tax=Actinospica durhamensis TaxID=1508375 RepID=A0A941IVJ0_9ACTN|nr:DUF4240 domain-containing protein [Actinospica durhamensis]MBR7839458.1 DUF4240 domain-containing protein [Actinospica durhamensis]